MGENGEAGTRAKCRDYHGECIPILSQHSLTRQNEAFACAARIAHINIRKI
jgi:hypothetical protein